MVSKFCKQLLLLCFIILSVSKSMAASGVGCVIEGGPGGAGIIYITEFGDTNWHGQKFRVYDRFGATYLKVYSGTISCGQTSSANVSPYTAPGYAGSTQCWVSNFHNPDNNDSTVGGYGAWVTYTSVTPCPLDDYVPVLVVFISILSFIIIRKKELNNFLSNSH